MQKEIKKFRQVIWDHHEKNRRSFPWRDTTDPYKILVSEVMLQQTQTSRVVSKYQEFIKKFPNFKALQKASLHEVLSAWQRLGYNRRAVALKKISEIVFARADRTLPMDVESLDALPGIGEATAASIAAFAFNAPTVFIETNIRRVFIHFFFSKTRKKVSDAVLLPLVDASLDRKNPREWYYALMDYGAVLPKTVINPNRRSTHYVRQSSFKGSNREIRGAILREMAQSKGGVKIGDLFQALPFEKMRISKNIEAMIAEGFFKKRGDTLSIAKIIKSK